MAEVGLLPFARVALEVSKTVIPRYRSRFSKHQVTQPRNSSELQGDCNRRLINCIGCRPDNSWLNTSVLHARNQS